MFVLFMPTTNQLDDLRQSDLFSVKFNARAFTFSSVWEIKLCCLNYLISSLRKQHFSLYAFYFRMLLLLQWDQSKDFQTTTGSDAGPTCSVTRSICRVYHVYGLQRQDKICLFWRQYIIRPQHFTLRAGWRNFLRIYFISCLVQICQ